MSSLFCRKPSSSIPKMPPPFIFWATGKSIFCSIFVNKVKNGMNNVLGEIVPYILHNIYFKSPHFILKNMEGLSSFHQPASSMLGLSGLSVSLRCFAFAELPWYQRKVAAIIFSSPPTSTYEEVRGLNFCC